MKILKWLVILLIYVLVFLTIKNIQIILPILFEYKEIILLLLTLLGTIFNIFFNIFISNKYINQVTYNTDKKE